MKQISLLVLLSLPLFGQSVFGQSVASPPMTPRAAARFLEQATWGPSSAAITQLASEGMENWLTEQFEATPSDLPDQPILQSDGKSNNDLTPVQAAFYVNAVNGPDQLRQRVAFILSQMLVVSQVSVHPAYAFPPYWRIFEANALGNYRDILKAITLSPAMGFYLDMANNNKANPAKGTAANENYARELMQLFALGLDVLNPDGTLALDANKNPIPTYNQAVVTNLAKVLTGWTYPTEPGATAKTNNPAYYFGQMFAVQSEHDTTAKTIFDNIAIPAGQTAEQDLDAVLNAMMQQPTMAPFVSKQLIQHLVTSNPSPAYVQRVSQVFTNTKGDMKAVITDILTDTEARAGDSADAPANPSFGHLREPILFLTSLVRGLNGTTAAANTLNGRANELGEDLFNAPSVFSYFSPQYRTEGLPGPEFQIYSTQTAADRADIVNTALYGTLDKNVMLSLTPFIQQAGNLNLLINYIGSVFLHGAMSLNLQATVASAANAQSTATAKAQAALYAVLTSGEYQVIH
jgi:uncharacterized protein (DUF1800 family)